MKITKEELRAIVKEELSKTKSLNEARLSDGWFNTDNDVKRLTTLIDTILEKNVSDEKAKNDIVKLFNEVVSSVRGIYKNAGRKPLPRGY